MIYRFRPACKAPGSNPTNRLDPHREQLNQWLRQIFHAGLLASLPQQVVSRSVRLEGDSLMIQSVGGRRLAWPLNAHPRIWLLAAGKAAAGLADAVYPMLQGRVAGGMVVLPDGVSPPNCPLPHMYAGHPNPDARGLMASRIWTGILKGTQRHDLVLVLISGGASAMLPSPVPGVSLEDKARLAQTLMSRGASIQELNVVRKHLSSLKGGRMAALAEPATTLTLVMSDVADDDLSVVASGPTVPDPSTYSDALSVLQKYEADSDASPAVMSFLQRGVDGLEEETPKPGDPLFRPTHAVTLADNRCLLNACAQEARSLGLNTQVLETCLCGEARSVGKALAERALDIKRTGMPQAAPACIIGGGETTVRVVGPGKGGRNQEVALAALNTLLGTEGIGLLSAASDGIDGPTRAAGAIAFGDSFARARSLDFSPQECLARNDSFGLFEALEDLIVIGPSGTNLLDVQIAIVL